MKIRRFELFATALIALSIPLSTNAAMKNEDLVLGVFPRQGMEVTTRMFSPLADHLSKELGRTVRLDVSKNHETFWQKVTSQRYDIVHYNHYQYVRSHNELGYEIIAKNEESGRDTIASALIVRKDSGIKSIEGLRGRKVVFGGGPSAMISSIVSRYMLKNAGLGDGDYIKEYASNAPKAVFSTYFGYAAASGAGNSVLKFPYVEERIDSTELRVLIESEPLPHLVWAVKGHLQDNLKSKIRSVLLSLKDGDQSADILDSANLTGLTMANDEEYDTSRQIIWEVMAENYCVRNCEAFLESMANSTNTSPLVMAIFPRRPPKLTKKMYQPLADYLSRGLDRPVDLVVNKEFASFWSGVGKKDYDIVHFNQFHYVKSHSLYGYNVIAKSEEFGSSTITPAIWVRKDNNLKSLQDLKGKQIMFGGGKMALVAGIGNQQLLMKAGLEAGDYEKQLAMSPMAGCRAMYLGQVDACGGATIFTSQPSVQKAIDTTLIEMLAQNQPLPGIPWAIKENMDQDIVERIKFLLLELNSSMSGRQILKSAALTGMHAANDTEYNVCRELIFDVLDERY